MAVLGRPSFKYKTDNEKDELIQRLRRQVSNLKRNPVSSFIEKKPDYHYALRGFYIVRTWGYHNGLTPIQLDILVILSFYKYFLLTDLRKWNMDHIMYSKGIANLITLGYVIRVEVPGKRYKVRKGWALTQKGLDVEKDFEKYYDEKMHDLENKTAGNKPNSKYRFDDGQYFRRVRKTRPERRAEQGGGMLPARIPMIDLYKDAYPNNEQSES